MFSRDSLTALNILRTYCVTSLVLTSLAALNDMFLGMQVLGFSPRQILSINAINMGICVALIARFRKKSAT